MAPTPDAEDDQILFKWMYGDAGTGPKFSKFAGAMNPMRWSHKMPQDALMGQLRMANPPPAPGWKDGDTMKRPIRVAWRAGSGSSGKEFWNDEDAPVVLGGWTRSQRRYYCGRNLGTSIIPGSDGHCGPNRGPQCPACVRFQQASKVQRKAGFQSEGCFACSSYSELRAELSKIRGHEARKAERKTGFQSEATGFDSEEEGTALPSEFCSAFRSELKCVGECANPEIFDHESP